MTNNLGDGGNCFALVYLESNEGSKIFQVEKALQGGGSIMHVVVQKPQVGQDAAQHVVPGGIRNASALSV